MVYRQVAWILTGSSCELGTQCECVCMHAWRHCIFTIEQLNSGWVFFLHDFSVLEWTVKLPEDLWHFKPHEVAGAMLTISVIIFLPLFYTAVRTFKQKGPRRLTPHRTIESVCGSQCVSSFCYSALEQCGPYWLRLFTSPQILPSRRTKKNNWKD